MRGRKRERSARVGAVGALSHQGQTAGQSGAERAISSGGRGRVLRAADAPAWVEGWSRRGGWAKRRSSGSTYPEVVYLQAFSLANFAELSSVQKFKNRSGVVRVRACAW